MHRKIIHIDMDAFYASVEQRDNPHLRGKAVVVGANPDARGVVSAASYEARQYGVHSAMPSAKAQRLCPDAVFVPVDMERYQHVSRQVMDILADYTPLVEQISVDEAFLDVTGSLRLFGTALQIGRELKSRIRSELGLSASVGIAPNKFLAKLASDHDKPDGLVVIQAGHERQFLNPLPISRLWGVGKATERRLQQLGIRTIGQLAAYPRGVLERQFGVMGPHLHELAQGRDDRPVVPEHEAKSLSSEHTYQTDTRSIDVMQRTLMGLAEDVGARLRTAGLKGRTIQLKLRFADFTTITRRRTLAHCTDVNDTIYGTAVELLQQAVPEGLKVRLLGVGMSNFGEPAQASLFDEPQPTHSNLDDTVDAIRRRFGEDTIKRGRMVDPE